MKQAKEFLSNSSYLESPIKYERTQILEQLSSSSIKNGSIDRSSPKSDLNSISQEISKKLRNFNNNASPADISGGDVLTNIIETIKIDNRTSKEKRYIESSSSKKIRELEEEINKFQQNETFLLEQLNTKSYYMKLARREINDLVKSTESLIEVNKDLRKKSRCETHLKEISFLKSTLRAKTNLIAQLKSNANNIKMNLLLLKNSVETMKNGFQKEREDYEIEFKTYFKKEFKFNTTLKLDDSIIQKLNEIEKENFELKLKLQITEENRIQLEEQIEKIQTQGSVKSSGIEEKIITIVEDTLEINEDELANGFEEDIETLKENLNNKMNELQNTNDELSSTIIKLQEIKKSNDESNKKIEILENELEEIKNSLKTSKLENSSLQIENKKIHEALKECENEFTKSRKLLEKSYLDSLDFNTEEIKKLSITIQRIENERNESENTVYSVKLLNKKLESEINTLKTKCQDYEKIISSTRTYNEKLQESLKERKDEYEREKVKYQIEMKFLLNESMDLRSIITEGNPNNEKEQVILEYESKIAHLKEDYELKEKNLENEISEKNKEISILQEKCQNDLSLILSLNKKLEMHKDHISPADHNEEINQNKKEILKSQKIISTYKEEFEILEKKIKDYEENLNVIEDKNMKSLKIYTNALELQKERIISLESQLQSKELELMNHKEEIKSKFQCNSNDEPFQNKNIVSNLKIISEIVELM